MISKIVPFSIIWPQCIMPYSERNCNDLKSETEDKVQSLVNMHKAKVRDQTNYRYIGVSCTTLHKNFQLDLKMKDTFIVHAGFVMMCSPLGEFYVYDCVFNLDPFII